MRKMKKRNLLFAVVLAAISLAPAAAQKSKLPHPMIHSHMPSAWPTTCTIRVTASISIRRCSQRDD
jgi:invasion protein IalB